MTPPHAFRLRDAGAGVHLAGRSRLAAVLAAVAAALALFQVTRPGLLLGSTPDVSVYLGGAVRLVHGAVPYRDYVFVQPPGFVPLAAPLGFLSDVIGTRDALGVLRLTTPLLAAANVLLVCRLVRHRGGVATLVAGTVMACFPAELYALRGPQLEPVVGVLCLLGAALLFEGDSIARGRRVTLAGLVLGFAATVKLSAVIPIAVLLVVIAVMAPRRLRQVGAGTLGGFAVPVLPFVALAPGAFWRDAVVAQLDRVPSAGRAPVVGRLGEMTGLAELRAGPGIVIAVSVALAALTLVAFMAPPRRPTALEWFALGATAAVVLAQVGPSQYYPQYAALLAPFVSVLLGLSAGRLAATFTARRLVPLVAAAACVAFLGAQVAYVRTESVPDTAALIDAVVPAGACALSNSPVYLVTADRFQAASPNCTTMTDPAGTTLALPSNSTEAITTWQRAFQHADYVVTDLPISRWDLPAAARVPEYVADNFRTVHAGALIIYVRSSLARALTPARTCSPCLRRL